MIPIDTPVPLPSDWYRIYGKLVELRNKSRNASIPEPLTPLILAGASISTSEDIKERWISHIKIANKYGFAEEILKILPPPPDHDIAKSIAGVPLGYRGSLEEATDNLFLYAEYDDLDEIEYAIENGATVYDKNSENKTALIVAAESGSLNAVQLLIEKGSNINEIIPEELDEFEGYTVLKAAIRGEPGYRDEDENSIRHEIVLNLLRSGLEHSTLSIPCWGTIPLGDACEFGMVKTVKALIDAGADIEGCSKNICVLLEQSPLYQGVESNIPEIVNILLNHGAYRLRKDDNWFRIPIHIAAYNGNCEIMDLLLKKHKQQQINSQDYYLKTPIHLPAENNQKEAYIYLKEKGADPTLKNDEGITAEHILENKQGK